VETVLTNKEGSYKMGELDSKFSRDDIETLIEAMGDWEVLGNQEFTLLQMIKGAPMPPEDHEAFDYMQQLKDHFRRREREIVDSRLSRQEKSVFLKAKLMLVRRDLGINQLFEMASLDTITDAEEEKIDSSACEGVQIPVKSFSTSFSKAEERLKMAEFFIRDLGVWNHYEKFLAEKTSA